MTGAKKLLLTAIVLLLCSAAWGDEFVPGPDWCRDHGPCPEGQGDCDGDDECAAGLVCVQDVGAKYGWPASRDVCERQKIEADGFVPIDRVTYFGTTDREIKVSWNHNDPHPDYYEITLYHVERETVSPAGIGKSAGNWIVFRLPRSGHFIAKVRACEGDVCGDWSASIDPEVAAVDGQPRAWWIYGYVAGPGDIVINPQ